MNNMSPIFNRLEETHKIDVSNQVSTSTDVRNEGHTQLIPVYPSLVKYHSVSNNKCCIGTQTEGCNFMQSLNECTTKRMSQYLEKFLKDDIATLSPIIQRIYDENKQLKEKAVSLQLQLDELTSGQRRLKRPSSAPLDIPPNKKKTFTATKTQPHSNMHSVSNILFKKTETNVERKESKQSDTNLNNFVKCQQKLPVLKVAPIPKDLTQKCVSDTKNNEALEIPTLQLFIPNRFPDERLDNQMRHPKAQHIEHNSSGEQLLDRYNIRKIRHDVQEKYSAENKLQQYTLPKTQYDNKLNDHSSRHGLFMQKSSKPLNELRKSAFLKEEISINRSIRENAIQNLYNGILRKHQYNVTQSEHNNKRVSKLYHRHRMFPEQQTRTEKLSLTELFLYKDTTPQIHLPKLKVHIIEEINGFAMTWKLDENYEYVDDKYVEYYHLFRSEQSYVVPITKTQWKRIGIVKALTLPMTCTLIQLTRGHRYCFCVVAVDANGREGELSAPCTANT